MGLKLDYLGWPISQYDDCVIEKGQRMIFDAKQSCERLNPDAPIERGNILPEHYVPAFKQLKKEAFQHLSLEDVKIELALQGYDEFTIAQIINNGDSSDFKKIIWAFWQNNDEYGRRLINGIIRSIDPGTI